MLTKKLVDIGTKTTAMYRRNIQTRGSVQTLKNRTKYSVSSLAEKLKVQPQHHLGNFAINLYIPIRRSGKTLIRSSINR